LSWGSAEVVRENTIALYISTNLPKRNRRPFFPGFSLYLVSEFHACSGGFFRIRRKPSQNSIVRWLKRARGAGLRQVRLEYILFVTKMRLRNVVLEHEIFNRRRRSWLRRVISMMIDEMGGNQCVEAENGAVALELLRNELFDFVITDINMPVMEGWELLADDQDRSSF